MNEEQIALARRAVACNGWRWIEGMLTLDSDRIIRVDDDGYKFAWRKYNFGYSPPTDALPDFQDPATLGCLLALVREAWADECAGHTYDEFGHGWFFKSRVRDGDGGNVRILGQFRSEAEALVAALEAAP
jgi:hypothetical protein